MNILEKIDNERLSVSRQVTNRLIEIEELKSQLEKEEKELRSSILSEMLNNNVDKCITDNVSFSQVIPKNKVEFDDDSFIMNESDDIVGCFVSFSVDNIFNEEKFKNEHPDLYEQYIDVIVKHETDIKKLEKTLPLVYKKYTKEIQSDKPISLRITIKKGV